MRDALPSSLKRPTRFRLDPTGKSPLPVERDRWGWLSSLFLGVAFGGLAMLYSLVVFAQLYHHHLRGLHQWWAPGDIWSVVIGGNYVWHGLLGQVYSAYGNSSYALPLSYIITAPVSALVNHWNLQIGILPLARPSAWLVVGPYSLLFGVFFLDAVRRLAWVLGLRRRLFALQVLTVLLVLVPMFQWGHFEDTIALIFVLHAIRYSLSNSYLRAAFLLSLAVSSKQWAILLVPFLVSQAPRGTRIRVAAAACALPALFVSLVLATDFNSSAHALFSEVNLVHGSAGHVAFFVTWLGTKTSQVSRTLGVLAALGATWTLRKVAGPVRLLAAMSLLLLFRPMSEAINFSYYWAPAFLVAGMVGVAAHNRLRLRDWIWQLAAMAWTLPRRASSGFWWAIFDCLLVGVWVQVAVNCDLKLPTSIHSRLARLVPWPHPLRLAPDPGVALVMDPIGPGETKTLR